MGMFRRRLGMEAYREFYELWRLQEMLLMFSAITTMPNVTMQEIVQSQNDFLLVDASEIEDLEDLSANICMMARIQQPDNDSKNGPIYDSAFNSEVQNPSSSFMNPLYSQKVNDGKVKHDKNTHDQQDNAMELLSRNAYKEVEKQQRIANKVNQRNFELNKELEKYKVKVQDFKNKNENKTNFHNEYIEADKQAKKLEIQFQTQFIQDRGKIMALEKEKEELQMNVSIELKQSLQLKNECTALKHKFNKQEDRYLDDILNLEKKVKQNENVVVKMSNSVQAMFMLGPKPTIFNDSQMKHSLGYENSYTLKKSIFVNPKLFDASYIHSSNVHAHVCDAEEILEDATRGQLKMKEKLEDLIAIEKKVTFLSVNYGKMNDLYETFVPQVELSLEQKYFSKAYTSNETTVNTNVSSSSSPPLKLPKPSELVIFLEGELAFFFEGELVVFFEGELAIFLEGELVTFLEGELALFFEGELVIFLEGELALLFEGELVIFFEGELAFSFEGELVVFF
ncbi:hypothetical protein Tco_1008815 [Tanacetum coccineum]